MTDADVRQLMLDLQRIARGTGVAKHLISPTQRVARDRQSSPCTAHTSSQCSSWQMRATTRNCALAQTRHKILCPAHAIRLCMRVEKLTPSYGSTMSKGNLRRGQRGDGLAEKTGPPNIRTIRTIPHRLRASIFRPKLRSAGEITCLPRTCAQRNQEMTNQPYFRQSRTQLQVIASQKDSRITAKPDAANSFTYQIGYVQRNGSYPGDAPKLFANGASPQPHTQTGPRIAWKR